MPYTGGYPSGTEIKQVRGRYSFAVDGGVIGTIPISATIPANSVILGGFAEVDTIVTGNALATLAVQVEAANDIVAAAAVTGAPWSTTGRKSVVPVFTGATTVKTTQARAISAVIAAEALTAGVVDVVLFYVTMPD